MRSLTTSADLDALDGQRVRVEGIYRKVRVTRRPQVTPIELDKPGTAQVATDDGVALMLEVYHGPKGIRPVEELQRFHERRVIVIGTAHRFTPSAVAPDGAIMQTMTGPYLGDIESITLAE
ncbi:MAG TPA: hypothetical protein VML75_04145 [Kofleriaceae bacterium]|nr:hypothetical protein [Kofleriaceae bacterium]